MGAGFMGSVVWGEAPIMHRISGHSLLRHWHGSYDMCMGKTNLSPGGQLALVGVRNIVDLFTWRV